jgi:hypothetical protein
MLSNMSAPLVLWARHCESCANVATTIEERELLPTVCTAKGLWQSLDLGRRVSEVTNALGLQPHDVSFGCSYLPRAMLTAALAAASFAQLTGRTSRVTVRPQCHIGEFSNASERQRVNLTGPACSFSSTESVITPDDYHCWVTNLNQRLHAAKLLAHVDTTRLHCGRSQDTTACKKLGLLPAWRHANGDAEKAREHLRSFHEAMFSMHVLVSHGSFIQASVLKLPFRPDRPRMRNTGIVLQEGDAVMELPGDRQDSLPQVPETARAALQRAIADGEFNVALMKLKPELIPLWQRMVQTWPEGAPCKEREAQPCVGTSIP